MASERCLLWDRRIKFKTKPSPVLLIHNNHPPSSEASVKVSGTEPCLVVIGGEKVLGAGVGSEDSL